MSAGPIDASRSPFAGLKPVAADAVRFDPASRLGAWQRVTHTATVPHVVEEVERCGAVENLRQVRDGGTEPFQGLWFADSDVYKVLEAVAWDAGRLGETQPSPFWTDTVELLAAAQRDDGYLNSWFQRIHPEKQWQDLGRGHEMYCAGHLIQAAVAAARAGVPSRSTSHAVLPTFWCSVRPRRHRRDVRAPRDRDRAGRAVPGDRTPALPARAARFIDLRGHGLLDDDGSARSTSRTTSPSAKPRKSTGHVVRQLYLARRRRRRGGRERRPGAARRRRASVGLRVPRRRRT